MKLSLYSGNLSTYYKSSTLMEGKKFMHVSYNEWSLELVNLSWSAVSKVYEKFKFRLGMLINNVWFLRVVFNCSTFIGQYQILINSQRCEMTINCPVHTGQNGL